MIDEDWPSREHLGSGAQRVRVAIGDREYLGWLEIVQHEHEGLFDNRRLIGGLREWRVEVGAGLHATKAKREAVELTMRTPKDGPTITGKAFVREVSATLARQPQERSVLFGAGPLTITYPEPPVKYLDDPSQTPAKPATMDGAGLAGAGEATGRGEAQGGAEGAVDLTRFDRGHLYGDEVRQLVGEVPDVEWVSAPADQYAAMIAELGELRAENAALRAYPGMTSMKQALAVIKADPKAVQACFGTMEVVEMMATVVSAQEWTNRVDVEAERDQLRAAVERVRGLCDEAERDQPGAVFSQGGAMWSVWTSEVRKALDSEAT